MNPKQPAVIIIKKARHWKHGHHGGAWKVAYADFVTAMMSFFLVMWIVGQNQDVRKGIAGYFRARDRGRTASSSKPRQSWSRPRSRRRRPRCRKPPNTCVNGSNRSRRSK